MPERISPNLNLSKSRVVYFREPGFNDSPTCPYRRIIEWDDPSNRKFYWESSYPKYSLQEKHKEPFVGDVEAAAIKYFDQKTRFEQLDQNLQQRIKNNFLTFKEDEPVEGNIPSEYSIYFNQIDLALLFEGKFNHGSEKYTY